MALAKDHACPFRRKLVCVIMSRRAYGTESVRLYSTEVQSQLQKYEAMVIMQCGERELEAGVDGKLVVNRAEDETLD